MKLKKRIGLAILFLLVVCFFQFGITVCAKKEFSQTQIKSGNEVRANTTPLEGRKKYQQDGVSEKISPPIRSLLSSMSEKGITRENLKGFASSDLFSSMIKLSEDGKIQTYIYLSEIDTEKVQILETNEAAIEIVNYSLRIVQAWVPFDKIYDLAQLNFVERIRTPDYAVPR